MLRSFRLSKFRQRNQKQEASSDVKVKEFHLAASNGDVEKVKCLLASGIKVNTLNEHGNTALHEAAWKGYSQTLRVLCQYKADVYVKNQAGFSALHLTCQNGHNQSCRILLLAGCKPDVKNSYGDTPLHTAARYGHSGVTRILISAHCHVSEINKNGDTGLHVAVAMGRKKLTQILLDAGCNFMIRNKQKEMPLDIARRKQFMEIEEILIDHWKRRHHQKKITKHLKKYNGTSQESTESNEKSEQQLRANQSHFIRTESKRFSRWHKKQRSPYGCHMFPNLDLFPPPKIYTLPGEPLTMGEQYYIDLGGNIKKGPMGFGHNCYCKPFINRVEKILETGKMQVMDHVDHAHKTLNAKLDSLERRTQTHLNVLSQTMEEKLECGKKECKERYEKQFQSHIMHKEVEFRKKESLRYEKHCRSKIYNAKSLHTKILDLHSESHHNLGLSSIPTMESDNIPRSRNPISFLHSKSEEILTKLCRFSDISSDDACLAVSEDNLLGKLNGNISASNGNAGTEPIGSVQSYINLNPANQSNLNLLKLKLDSMSEGNLTNINFAEGKAI